MTEEDRKYLAEKMGLCWHEPKIGYWQNCTDGRYGVPCKNCGIFLYDKNDGIEEYDFTSEHGFFVVFEWAKKQEWWDEFLDQFHQQREAIYFCFPLVLIGPRFAEELVEFLREKEMKDSRPYCSSPDKGRWCMSCILDCQFYNQQEVINARKAKIDSGTLRRTDSSTEEESPMGGTGTHIQEDGGRSE